MEADQDRGRRVSRGAGPASRCVITTTDQATGERGVEPLRTLARYRRDPAEPTNVKFGQNLVHESNPVSFASGDPVEILE